MNRNRKRTWGVVVGALLTGLSGLAVATFGVLSLASGHGGFSWGIAAMLIGYGLALGAAAWGLWRLSLFARGPIVAMALMHLAIATSYLTGPTWWAGALIACVPIATLVAVLWPSTTAELRARRTAAKSI